MADGIIDAVKAGTPLLAIPQTDALSDGVAKQLAAAGAFTYNGAVGDLRAPWMGNWYFVRKHTLYEGMPVDQAMGIHYQARGKRVERVAGGPRAGRGRGRDYCGILARPLAGDRRRNVYHAAGRGQDRLPARAGVAAGAAGALPVECTEVANESSFGVVILHVRIEMLIPASKLTGDSDI